MVNGSRREAMARARLSRRPSRLGLPAGKTAEPDRVHPDDAGFPGLLARTWEKSTGTADLDAAMDLLLTLDGHVPAEVQLRALGSAEEAAVAAVFGRTWRRPGFRPDLPAVAGETAFVGEFALTAAGRIAIRTPSDPPLAGARPLVDGVRHVVWTPSILADYRRILAEIQSGRADSVLKCREWLAALGRPGRGELLDRLIEASLRTAPFVLYQEDLQYSNFRDPNNLTGRTLWPGHPDCALSGLRGLPLEVWSDGQVVLVVALALLVRSAGPARIEEANGTQLSIAHVADLLERIRLAYNAAEAEAEPIAPAAGPGVAALAELADKLGARRSELRTTVQMYREIDGALLHKRERIARPPGPAHAETDRRLAAALSDRLPVSGRRLRDLAAAVRTAPGRLAEPYGDFDTGLEALVHAAVSSSVEVFGADFAMSRGLRSLPRLIAALRAEDWARIVGWEIAEYFCCVVPGPDARRHFDGTLPRLADIAWSMSARMQYNSWHFLAGNLPRTPEVLARDFFFPPTIPDVSRYSDQHHHGHIAGHVRFSIRSPQPVRVLDRTFAGFVDLRLLRCSGPAFTEHDLLAAHSLSSLVATATEAAADLAAGGRPLEVTAFDTAWHWAAIAGAEAGDRYPFAAPATA
ncbi:hypothetical protein BJY24_006335 [Nocardia transvalensis]|uniref:Uncharacterized protein n=1 Tax=Nocardia transvalensis TaxID=37333 RepID=A0A7W9PKZ3_9NOCA|nr:hypothetical protein [Nocardia transvalensis]MBB5917423.1 hypothetical protein [Nocardia transvalensis]